MSKHGWSCLLLGILFTTFVACRPVTDEDDQGYEPVLLPSEGEVTAVAQQPTAKPNPTKSPPPKPSVVPTPTVPNRWQLMGNTDIGLQIAAPPEWIHLSSQLVTPSGTPLGLITLLTADSEHTGSSLLAGKSITAGAYVMGLISNFTLPDNNPLQNLEMLLASLHPTATPLSNGALMGLPSSGGAVSGAYLDVAGDLSGFLPTQQDHLRTRILLLTPTIAPPGMEKQAIFLFTAPATVWESFAATFDLMMQTIVVYDIHTSFAIGGGLANVIGEITADMPVNGRLDSQVKDVWTFEAENGRYATLFLTPDEPHLDLVLTIVDPNGEVVAQVDNGYTNTAETSADILLAENGTYYIEVADFSNQPGQYTLQLTQSDEPLFSGGGQIEFGQGIQSQLLANNQHIWTFHGTAGQPISIVLTPDNTIDAILNLYSPEGERLVALDEGFSGDAEVVSGFILPVTGEYNILVRSFAGNNGSYTLVLEEGGEQVDNFYDAGDLIYGDNKQETLQPNEVHVWFFEGGVGDEVVVEVVPIDKSLDIDVWLLDPNLERLAAVDDLLAGGRETIRQTLLQGGQYLVLVQEFYNKPGNYEIHLTATPAQEPVVAGDIGFGEPVEGTIGQGELVIWQLEAVSGDTVDILLVPTDITSDLVLLLLDPQGNTMITADSGLAGEPEQIENFVFTLNGQWQVMVREFFDAPATYELTISEAQ